MHFFKYFYVFWVFSSWNLIHSEWDHPRSAYEPCGFGCWNHFLVPSTSSALVLETVFAPPMSCLFKIFILRNGHILSPPMNRTR